MKKRYIFLSSVLFLVLIVFFSLLFFSLVYSKVYSQKHQLPSVSRFESIPPGAVKITPDTDIHPPLSLSSEFDDPIPLPYPVNTAGGEDSAFILPDGKTLYFWFTPDVDIPPEKQLIDGVTGIYVSQKSGSVWGEPKRVLLQDPKRLSLDGCSFFKDDMIWFCSAREGYVPSGYGSGLNWFTAESDDEYHKWKDWKLAGFPKEYEIGELHIHGDELYFHSSRPGGKGGLDIWVMRLLPDSSWSAPVNLEAVNTKRDDGFPAVSPDGSELWFSRDYGLWRSKKNTDGWSEPELMISPLAGEASLDSDGNVYFTHHFFRDDKMIEADIYVAYRKK